MKAVFTATALVLLLLGSTAMAGVDVSVSADEDGIKSFHLAIGDHYRVQQKEIVIARERNIPEDDQCDAQVDYVRAHAVQTAAQ